MGTAEDSARPVLIGYWKSDHEPDWPDPRDFVDTSWSACERREVAEYLSNGTVVVEFRGLSPCRFCGQRNGHREFTDGTYQWPEGLAHYLWVHEVRLPVAVVAHIKSRLVGFEGDGLDREWWRTAHIDLGAAIHTATRAAAAVDRLVTGTFRVGGPSPCSWRVASGGDNGCWCSHRSRRPRRETREAEPVRRGHPQGKPTEGKRHQYRRGSLASVGWLAVGSMLAASLAEGRL